MWQSIIIHTICGLLLGASAFALKNIDAMFAQNRRYIATVQNLSGEARVRPIDLSLWRDISPSQMLYEGDVLVTGRKSYARLIFQDGRTVDLDENSLITLGAEDSQTDSAILVTLVQGSISTSASKNSALASEKGKVRNLKLVSSETKLALNSQAADVQISKTLGDFDPGIKVIAGSVAVENSKTGKVIELKKSEVLDALQNSDVLAALRQGNLGSPKISQVAWIPPPSADVELPKVSELAPVEEIAAVDKSTSEKALALATRAIMPGPEDFPDIVSPAPGQILWTARKLDQIDQLVLPIVMSLPNIPEGEKWVPLLEAKGSIRSVFKVKRIGQRLTQNLAMGAVKPIPGEPGTSGNSDVFLQLRPGVAVASIGKSGDKNPVEKFSAKESTIAIRSLQTLFESPLYIRISKVNPRAVDRSDWIFQNSSNRVERNIEISTKSKGSYSLLWPLIAGDEFFEIATTPKYQSDRATYFVRDARIIARSAGRQLDREDARKLIQSLDADFAYFGNEQAYFSGVRNFTELQLALKTAKGLGEVFVYDDGSLISLKVNLIARDPKAISTLLDGTSRYFREKVVITELSH